ncbi:hypothetical protein DMJ13_12380 [halophilic archaeon]|nr:hypothetical protein DMJ13_12380 [halophilic archaeon]
MGTNFPDDEENHPLTRRSFLAASSALAGAGALGVGAHGVSAASDAGASDEFLNWRAREASNVWKRGYRGRQDRTVGLTDSGLDARHPGVGPWNGVQAFVEDGEVKLTKPDQNDVERERTGDAESFSGTVGPGTFATGEETYHEFTAPSGVAELDAELSWSPNVDATNDLEFRLDEKVADGWQTVTRAATASMPETMSAPVEAGTTYRFVVEVYVNTTTTYEISGTYYEMSGTVETYDPSVVFDFVGGETTPDTPKAVGWYDPGSRYGYHERPRDPNGHGTHCSSIMGDSGRATAIDPDRVREDEPRTALSAVTGNVLAYEVEAEQGEGVYGSAYGDLIDLRIEGPDGETRDTSATTSDVSTLDNNVVEAPADRSGTYTVYVQTAEGETATAAYVETVSVGAFVDPDATVGGRTADGDQALHTGVAPDQSLVCFQGLSAPTEDLADQADQFSDVFNLRAVNMSWGYAGGLPLGAAAGTLDTIPNAVKDIAEAGVLTLAAAGNAATPVNGNGSPAVADECVSVVATGPLDGISAYSSGGVAGVDEDADFTSPEPDDAYMKPDVTAPGGYVTDLVDAAKTGLADAPESEQDPIRDYTGKAGTSMATPFTTGATGLVAQAMEEDAPDPLSLPAPDDTTFDDVMALKQVLLATATETAFTAAPYHRVKAPEYDFGGRDPWEGYGRLNPGPAVDAVTREMTEGTISDVFGLNVPDDERAVAGFVRCGRGAFDVSVDFSHYSGGNAGATKGDPHVDLFVYDAENPAQHGEPNVVARDAGPQGSPSVSVTTDESKYFFVVAKLVDVPGAVNGDDVQAHVDLSFDVTRDFVVSGTRTDDGSVFTGGQTDQIDLDVTANETVQIRDVVPEEWGVETDYGDVARVEHDPDRGVKYVYFSPGASDDLSVTYFADAPAEAAQSNRYTFGPVQARPDGSGTWYDVSGTSDANTVVAQST